MALVDPKDLVEETATANTTVSFTLTGATTGHRTWASTVGNGDQYYCARGVVFSQWEVGLGTLSGSTLTRTTVIASSNSNAAVTFTGHLAAVRNVLPASVIAELLAGIVDTGTLIDDGLSGSAITIDFSDPTNPHLLTIDDDCAISFTPPSGTSSNIVLYIDGGAGGFALTWPDAEWINGPPKTINAGEDLLTVAGTYDGTTFRLDHSPSARDYLSIAQNSTPADADVATSEAQLWFDNTIGATAIRAKVKDSAGTVVSKTLLDSTSPTMTGTPTAPTAASGTNTTQVATTEFVQTALVTIWKNKGDINCSANPNYPAGLVGDTYRVSVAGKIGGASGDSVDAGDVVSCKADNAGGTKASVGSSWYIIEHNLVGALLSANNLSDVANAATAVNNLGGATSTGSGGLMRSTSGRVTTEISPATNDGAALGTTALQWSDAFLASGGVINWANSTLTLTQSAGRLTLFHTTAPEFLIGSPGINGYLWLGDFTNTTIIGMYALNGIFHFSTSLESEGSIRNTRIERRSLPLSNPGATPTINTDLYDVVNITGQTADITSFTTNLTGTPVEGDMLRIAITGTAARALTWGAKFEASGNVALPTTTATTARLDVVFAWNTATTKWRCVGVA